MIPGNSNRNLSILIHILGWLMLCVVLLLLSPLSWRMGEIQLPEEYWWKQVLLVLLLISVFYTNQALLVPRILLRGKTQGYLLLVLLGGVLFYYAIVQLEQLIEYPLRMHETFNPDRPFNPKKRWVPGDVFQVMLYLVSIGLGTSLALIQTWQKEEKARELLEKQRIKTELSYLKAQINPHFFFNTLNNIYSLTNLNIQKAQEALLKLSRMMRYVLYETEKETTLLKSEVNFIQDYLELMKMRLTEKVNLDIQLDEPTDRQVIAPMILLPFLENCFKHGISTQHESSIRIKLELMGDSLFLETKNKIFPQNPENPESAHHGIGLANTQRRLSLLYPDRYLLKFGEDPGQNMYTVNLTIELE